MLFVYFLKVLRKKKCINKEEHILPENFLLCTDADIFNESLCSAKLELTEIKSSANLDGGKKKKLILVFAAILQF